MSSCDQKRSENQRKVEIKDDNLEINTDRVINKWKRWVEMIAQSIERVWAVIVVGATGCGVVDELVRDFDAYFRIGCWALSEIAFVQIPCVGR